MIFEQALDFAEWRISIGCRVFEFQCSYPFRLTHAILEKEWKNARFLLDVSLQDFETGGARRRRHFDWLHHGKW